MERQALIKFEAFDAAHNKRSFALYPHDVPDVARGRAKLALYAALNKDVLAVRHPDGHLMDPTDTFSAGLDTPYRVERLQVVAAADLLDWTSLGLTREELRARAGSARRSAVLRMPVHGRDIMVVDTGTRLFALDAVCYHFGGPLAQGDIEDTPMGCTVTCPWHRYKIDLATGHSIHQSVDHQPTLSAVPVQRTHDVRVDASSGMVQVRLRLDGECASDTYALMGLFHALE